MRVGRRAWPDGRYLPGVKLPTNVVAVPDPVAAVHNATLLIFVLPHQFVHGLCSQLKGKVGPGCRAISLIKVSDVWATVFPPAVLSSLTIPWARAGAPGVPPASSCLPVGPHSLPPPPAGPRIQPDPLSLCRALTSRTGSTSFQTSFERHWRWT